MERMETLLEEVSKMRKDMDRTFGNFLGRGFEPGTWLPEMLEDYRTPLVDVEETEKEMVISVEIPGVDKNDIKVSVSKGNLEIKAEKKEVTETKKKREYRYIKSYRGFYRSISLPDYVDEKTAKSSYRNGVLRVVLPKKGIGKKMEVKVE